MRRTGAITQGEDVIGNDARLGVLVASLLAAMIGTAILLPGDVDIDRSMVEHTSTH